MQEEQRNVEERPKAPTTRERSARSKVSQVHQQPEPEQSRNQEVISAKERLKGCIPTDTKTFLFALVAIVYLIVGVIHFFGWTGDTSMLTILLQIVGGYRGLTEVTAVILKKGHDLQPPTSE